MAWVKIPAENHDVLRAALPKDPRVETLKMFGGLAALVNGNMFGGLFGRSFIVKLGEADYAEAMQLDGAEPFDPMGNGRVMSNTVFMPEAVLDEPTELRDWLRRAFDHARTLPAKQKKPPKPAAKPAKRPARVKKVTTKRASKKPARRTSR